MLLKLQQQYNSSTNRLAVCQFVHCSAVEFADAVNTLLHTELGDCGLLNLPCANF